MGWQNSVNSSSSSARRICARGSGAAAGAAFASSRRMSDCGASMIAQPEHHDAKPERPACLSGNLDVRQEKQISVGGIPTRYPHPSHNLGRFLKRAGPIYLAEKTGIEARESLFTTLEMGAKANSAATAAVI